MNELERAATPALRERPSAAPPPIEAIERRSGTLRRRRRLLEAGAIALVVPSSARGQALSAVRSGDDDQGVFVGEGPVEQGRTITTCATTGSALRSTPDRPGTAAHPRVPLRLSWAKGTPQVQVDGTDVTVTTTAPGRQHRPPW